MVANIIIVLILLSLYYAYTNHNREFTATASAIQQIWSGTCRLSCRQSAHSEYSGLSGLTPEQTQAGCLAAQSNLISGCVCESCPCKLVENVLRTCSPATNIYSRSIEFISDCYYDLIKTAIDLFHYLEQALRSGSSGQRETQLYSIGQFDSGANINFSMKNEDTDKEKGTKSLKSRSITFRTISETNELKHEATSSKKTNIALNLEISEPVINTTDSKNSLALEGCCPKCVEKGKTCMVACPHDKRNRK